MQKGDIGASLENSKEKEHAEKCVISPREGVPRERKRGKSI